MKTVTFTSGSGSVDIQVDGEEAVTLMQPTTIYKDDSTVSFLIDDMSYAFKTTDAITIDGVAFSGTLTQLSDALEAVFPTSGGSGAGAVLESYQNSVMSAPVQAYVYRDADNNIVRVYEPLRNNDVSRSQYAYADSIDKFPFDSINCFNTRLSDVKLVGVNTDVQMKGCQLDTMVINGGGFTGLQLINHTQRGSYGLGCENAAELYIVGNTVRFSNCSFYGEQTFIDSIGANSEVYGLTMLNDANQIYCNGHTGLYLGDGLMWEDVCRIHIYYDNSVCFDFQVGGNSSIHIGSGTFERFRVGDNCDIGGVSNTFLEAHDLEVGNHGYITPLPGNDNVFALNQISVGVGSTVALSAEPSVNSNYINISGTTYLMGVSGSNMTLTAI